MIGLLGGIVCFTFMLTFVWILCLARRMEGQKIELIMVIEGVFALGRIIAECQDKIDQLEFKLREHTR